MGTIHRFRQVRHGEPNRLSTPEFVRRDQARARGRRLLGVAVLAVLIAAALLLYGVRW